MEENEKAQYENKSITDEWIKGNNWTRKDFRHKNILFFKREKFPKPWKNEQFAFDEEYKVFSFSEPIYYDEKYAVLLKQKQTHLEKHFLIHQLL